ncbi:MAG: hypothetical protein JSV33_16035 [bacterium]|nr:MAG: hypothetical protein JSV33_16035 [bacterium]
MVYERCPLCRGTLEICSVNEGYQRCRDCNTQYKVQADSKEEAAAGYFKEIDSTLRNDKRHYDILLKELYGEPGEQTDFGRFVTEMKFATIYSIGGGFPKFESYFTANEIKVYDLAAEEYNSKIALFRSTFGCFTDISYHTYNLDEDTSIYEDILSGIDSGSPNLVTFIHLWEHLSPVVFSNMLDDMRKARSDNLYYVVYQPNVSVARHKSWCHYGGKGHITLVPYDTMLKLLKIHEFKIIYSAQYSDDMLIIYY